MEEIGQSVDKVLKRENFGQVCRSCLLQGPMASIFELKYEDTLFSEILNKLFCAQVNSDDQLPKNICETCIAEIIRFYNFKKTYDKSEEILQSIITEEMNKMIGDPALCDAEMRLEDFVNTITISNNNPIESCSVEVPQSYAEMETYEITSDEDLQNENYTINSLEEAEIHINSDSEDASIEESIVIENIDNVDNFFNELSDGARAREELKREGYILENVNDSGELRIRKLSNGIKKKIGPPKLFKPKIFTCSCQKTFALQSEYIKHRKEEKHPRPRNHSCKICQKSFTRNGLKQHMRRHTKEQPYQCKICAMKFSLSGNLRRHMRRHTGEKPHVCEFCGKGFIQAPSLTAHKRIHTGEKPFLCTYCGKRYGNSLVYKLHLQRHDEGRDTKSDKSYSEETFECKFCHKAFGLKTTLNTHLLIHGEKKFLCSNCGKGFYSNAALQSHSKVHTGEKPYSCSFCHRTFSQSGSLKTHTFTHTGNKPYVCEICSKAFTQRPHLKTHLRTHSGERPYTCTYCCKTFPHSGTLRVHIRTHTGETPYMCDMCPRGFYDSSSLKRHRKRHAEEATDIKSDGL